MKIGSKVFIRTVTNYYTGEVVDISEQKITLVKASWVADTGRFSEAMRTGEFSEVEPYPADMRVSVFTGAIVDLCEWPHKLPAEK